MKKTVRVLCVFSVVFMLLFALNSHALAAPKPELAGYSGKWFFGIAYCEPISVYIHMVVDDVSEPEDDEDTIETEEPGEAMEEGEEVRDTEDAAEPGGSEVAVPEESGESEVAVPEESGESEVVVPEESGESEVAIPEESGESEVTVPEESGESEVAVPEESGEHGVRESVETGDVEEAVGTELPKESWIRESKIGFAVDALSHNY